MSYNKILMVILKALCLFFIVYAAYTEGQYNYKKEMIKRVDKLHKVEYSVQDVEIIIFGEIQE